MLAGLQRESSVTCVAVVTGRDHDRVDLAIAEQLARVGGGLAEAVSLGERLGVGAFGRADAFEAQVRERGKARHEHGLRVITRTDLPQSHRAARLFAPEGERARLQFEHALLGLGVLEHDTHCLIQIAARNPVEHRDRFGEWKPVRDEPRYRELALRDQIEEGLHVAVGRPAHVADRVVVAAREIVRLVDPRPHRAAEEEIDLFAEPCAPFQLDGRVAQAHHAAAVAHQHGGELDRTEVLGGGGEQHRIDAETAACAQRVVEGLIGLRTASRLGTVLQRERALARVEVDSDHAASVRAAKLHQELPEQAEADDGDAFAQLELRLAYRLERDRADGARAGGLEAHVGRNAHHQVPRHGVVFGVRCHSFSDARHSVAHPELVHVGAHFHHGSGAAVTESGRSLEALLHFAERGDKTLLAERVEHQPDLIGALLRLLHEAHARLGDLHLFGAHAHERVVIAHEQVACADRGDGHLADIQGAVAEVLADLFHFVLEEKTLCRIIRPARRPRITQPAAYPGSGRSPL